MSAWRRLVLVLVVGAALAFCAPALAYLPAGSGWEWGDQQPYEYLFGVAFGDATHGWAVGQDYDVTRVPQQFGVISATTDGAASWSAQDPGTEAILSAIASTDAAHAWAVGLGGTIVATSNGGATWTQRVSGTAANLNAVAFPTATRGWAVGQGGVIRRTTNGGSSWSGQVSGTTDDVTCVTFPKGDTTHGWAIAVDEPTGYPSSILATSNGGATWTTQLSGLVDELTSISFPDALHGWAVTFNGTLYYTSDGGATWNDRRMTDSDNHPGGIVFVDATHGWAAGGTETEPWGAYIWATRNGGVSWQLQNKGGGPEVGMDAIAFPDLLHGYVVGESGSTMATRTGGQAPVTLKLSGLKHGALRLGSRATASGFVTPAHEPGDRVTVTVQRKRSGHWVTAASSSRTQTLAGSYQWKYRPGATGTYRMKAAVRRTAGHPAALTLWKNFSVR